MAIVLNRALKTLDYNEGKREQKRHSFADDMLRCVPSRAGNVLQAPERKVCALYRSHLGTVYRGGWARARASPWAACA